MEITIKGTAKEVSQLLLEIFLPPEIKLLLRNKGALTTISAEERNEAMRQQGHQASPLENLN